MPTFYEFFAGGGMARAGLSGWTCLFANDFEAKKTDAYTRNYPNGPIPLCEDVGLVTTEQLPGAADLAWASFPCQDLSLAGAGLGLSGQRSGSFWQFWRLIKSLRGEGRAPKLIGLENVCGALTSHGGRDFAAIGRAMVDTGYQWGALVIDAKHFVPQSRPRLFIIGVDADVDVGTLVPDAGDDLVSPWRTPALKRAVATLDPVAAEQWRWWRLPSPAQRNTTLADVVGNEAEGIRWHSPSEVEHILAMMTPVNRRKIEAAAATGLRHVGGIYRRVRPDADGIKRQRAEVRFDGLAGCLRTPAGGSSRQTVVIVEGETIRTRLLSAREAADLMGLPPGYVLPERYNDAYHLLGDGVAAPVVKHLAEHLLTPLLKLVQSTIEQRALRAA